MILDSKNIIFTDGSSRGNPGPGGWGAIIVYNDSEFKVESLPAVATSAQAGLNLPDGKAGLKVVEIGGREDNTTNNRMEMTAVIKALEFLLSASHSPLATTLFTDSSYVINGATKWAKGWKKNGWKTKNKEDVLNKDLWEQILSLTQKFEIEWKHIEGHAGIIGNERCDQIATSFADKEKAELFLGPIENYKIDIFSLEKNSLVSKTKKSSSVKAYSYISKVDGKILIHKTWKECEARVKGQSGARFKKSFSKEDEERIIAEFSK